MGNRQFSNEATSILAGTINSSATTVAVSAGEGTLFPLPTGTQFFIVVVQDTSGNYEFMKCTARSGDSLTVVRGQEGTTAQGFTANLARVELRDTAGTLGAFYQKDGDTLTGDMNLGNHNVTNGVLGASIQIINAEEIVNTPIRGATADTSNQLVVPADGTRATAGGARIVCVGDVSDAFAIGMVMMWNAAIPDIPTGWNICDGTNGTPDLRDRFIVGAGTSYTLGQSGTNTNNTSAVSGGTPVISAHTLTTGEIPSHLHPFDYFSGGGAQGIGVPGYSTTSYFLGGSGSQPRTAFAGSPNVGGGGGHDHPSAALAAHQHVVTFEPYYALFYIMYIG